MDDGQVQVRQFVEQLARALLSGVSPRAGVDADEAVDPGLAVTDLEPLEDTWRPVQRSAWTRRTTQSGLPSEVTKKRTLSSRAISIHSSMRRRYVLDDCSIRAFMPIGRLVRDRMNRSPSRNS